ncbi:tail fiber protein [Paenibacillus silvae]|uniref:WD40 repeat domain-containing protein n=1 Tax=Paenibacillus silvae TaxID=1325358 RepID=A0A2W6P372_9BACL|nr:tail fiber protein [Paenibacillus silvae]PZT54130.1 hypothetical protein DN757_19055 [Paenibacillus silvae]
MALQQSYPAAVNSRQTELVGTIDDTQTSFEVLDGSALPDAPNLLTLGTDESAETILYTAKSGNQITGVTRGFEGVAKSWVAGTKLARYFTAYDHDTFRQNVSDLNTRLDNIPAPQDASLTQKGVVQLSNATESNSETEAATPKAINTVRQQADTKIGDLTQLQTTDKDSLVDALNEVFTHVDEGKELVKTAVIVKGGTVVGTSPHSFQQLADGIDTIETSTVINGQMKQSITFGESIQAFDPVVTYEGFLNNNTISGGLPTGTGRGATWTPDGVYLAIAHQEAPFLSIYKKSAEGIFIKLANPAILPTGIAIDAAFSPDGVYLAVAHVTSPFITVYKRTGDTFTKLANPILPADYTWSVAWSPDSVYLAVGVSSSGSVPSIALYKRNGDSLNKINNPSSYPAATIYGVAFSPSGTYLAVASGISPYLMVYRRTGDSFVALSAPTIIPGSTMYYVSWHPSETMLAIGGAAGQTTPALSLYRFSGSLLTKINDSDDLPSTTINRLTFSPDGKLLSTANGGAASVRFVSYRVVGETLIKLPDPEFLLPAAGYAIAYSPNSQYLAIGYQGGNYLSIFTINTEARKSTNAIADLKKALSAGYAIESGSAGETKEIITIWRS